MWHTLDTVGGVWSNAITVTKVVTASSIDVGTAVSSRPVGLALTEPVEVFKGVWLTGNTVLGGGACTSNTDRVTLTLVDVGVAVRSLPLEVAGTLCVLVLGCIVDTVVAVGGRWAVTAVADWVASA